MGLLPIAAQSPVGRLLLAYELGKGGVEVGTAAVGKGLSGAPLSTEERISRALSGLVGLGLLALHAGGRSSRSEQVPSGEPPTDGSGGPGAASPTGTIRPAAGTAPPTPARTTAPDAIVPYQTYPPSELAPEGFMGGFKQTTELEPGTQLSRYGAETGTYTSPAGTPFGQRGLQPRIRATGEQLYEVVDPFQVQGGIVYPWGEGGLGVQWQLPASVTDLLRINMLRKL